MQELKVKVRPLLAEILDLDGDVRDDIRTLSQPDPRAESCSSCVTEVPDGENIITAGSHGDSLSRTLLWSAGFGSWLLHREARSFKIIRLLLLSGTARSTHGPCLGLQWIP